MQDFAGGAAELYFCKGKITECPQKYKRKERLFSEKCTIAWDIYGIYAELCLIAVIHSKSNPIRSLVPEQISMDCWADGCSWVRRRSGLRQERTFSLIQMSRTELARVMPWRENEGWNPTRNKVPTRKWKMAGSYILCKKLHNNGLMTDLGLIYWIGFRRESGIEVRERTTWLRP